MDADFTPAKNSDQLLSVESSVREESLAGRFYPAEKEFLSKVLDRYLAGAPADSAGRFPKAIIAPHSGLIYSGPIAASAYAQWRGATAIRRVVVIGPSHKYEFPGIAVPDSVRFRTPLGELKIDESAAAHLVSAKLARVFEAPFLNEQSIELQLPFIQKVLGAPLILPLITSSVDTVMVEEVLNEVWGGPETAIVLSCELSQNQSYESAVRIDRTTSGLIQKFEAGKITADQACGHRALRGFLRCCSKRKYDCECLDLRTSADTTGLDKPVAGYGAFALFKR